MRAVLIRFRWPLVAAVAALVVFVAVWFQPQTLFFDTVVDQALPEAEPGAAAPATDETDEADEPDETGTQTTPADPPESDDADEPPADENPADVGDDASGSPEDEPAEQAAPAGPLDLATGTFGSLGRYTTMGQVRVVELEDGRRFVRLEDFETDNGPDLFVYLSNGPADGSEGFTDDFVDLGDLQGNIGDQNYEIDPDVDLDLFTSVVIYCKRFSSPFGAANLMASS